MILVGILFISNIVGFNNPKTAINMHDDLIRNASLFMINMKVFVTFITGAALLVSSYGIIFNRLQYTIGVVVCSSLFILLYLVEVMLWIKVHPVVVFYCITIGGLNLVFILTSYKYWKNRYANS
jgi:hypothetical protein